MNSYEKLKAAVMKDCIECNGVFNPDGCLEKCIDSKCYHKWCDKFKWVIDRAKYYGDKLCLNWEDILDSWEQDRNCWYMNYYQASNQPKIDTDKVIVFETIDDLKASIGDKGFRCPMCKGISTNAYECDSGLVMSKGKICDWKVYGLFGDIGEGIFVYLKDKLKGQDIFMPIAWEEKQKED